MKNTHLLSELKTILHPKRLLCLAMAGLLCVGSIQALSVNASSAYEDVSGDASNDDTSNGDASNDDVSNSDGSNDSTSNDGNSNDSTANANDSYDDDFNYYAENPTDYSGGEDPYEYSLTCDQSVLSFGKVTKGAEQVYLPFRLSNTGSTPIDLVWYMTGNENGPFRIEQSDSDHLEPGESCEFHVSVDASLAAGTYNAAFRASDDLDPGGSSGVVLPMSVTIEEKKPCVTSVTVYPDTATVAKGSTMSFSAKVKGENDPDLSVSWSVSNNQSSGTYIDGNGKLVVDAKEGSGNLTVVASSVLDPKVKDSAYVSLAEGNHTVSVQADPSAGGTVWGGGSVSNRGSCDIYAAPNNGYQFIGWKYNNQVISTSTHYTIPSVTEDMSVTAAFKQNDCYVSVRKNHDKAGSVTSSQNVGYGGSITLKADTNDGYRFDCWKEGDNVISRDAQHTVSNITGNREFTAYFTRTQYKVSVSVTPQDTGYTAGGASYNAGDNVTLTATSYNGYHFEKWTSGDKVLGTDQTLVINNLQADISIVANFAKDNAKKYTITAICANEGGTISPAGDSSVCEGSNVIYSIVPKSGYMVSNVVVDKVSVGAVYSYTFTAVKANHAIAVSFQPVPAAASTSAASTDKKDTAGQSASAGSTASKENAASAGSTASKDNAASKNSTASAGSTGSKDNAASAGSTDSTGSTAASESQTAEDSMPVDEDGNYDPHHDDDALTDPTTLEEYNDQTGVFQILNITPSDARAAIESGDDAQLLQLAYNQDYLMVNIHNEYSTEDSETSGSHFLNTADFPNLEYVINDLLTEEDKMCAFAGNEVSFNLTMYSANDFPTEADEQIQKSCDKNSLSVGEMFEVLMVKSTHGDTQVIKEFTTPMQVVMRIPDSIRESGRAYCIVRSHEEEDGSLTISFLQDLDDDPDTITFETDRLSSYAIAYQESTAGMAAVPIIKVIIAVLIAAIVITVIVGIVSGTRRGGRHGKKQDE